MLNVAIAVLAGIAFGVLIGRIRRGDYISFVALLIAAICGVVWITTGPAEVAQASGIAYGIGTIVVGSTVRWLVARKDSVTAESDTRD